MLRCNGEFMGTKPLATIVYIDDEPDIRHVVELSLSLAEGLTVHTGSPDSAPWSWHGR